MILTYLMIATTTLCTLAAQLILKKAVNLPSLRADMAEGPFHFILGAAMHPLVWAALVLQVFGYVVWFFVLTREKLAVSFALSGAMIYMLTAIFAWVIFGERLSGQQWVGIALISAGVIFVAYQA